MSLVQLNINSYLQQTSYMFIFCCLYSVFLYSTQTSHSSHHLLLLMLLERIYDYLRNITVEVVAVMREADVSIATNR